MEVVLTSFAPSNLPEFRRPFILRGAVEVVGVVHAAGERHLLLVSIVTETTYVFLVRQHLRHDDLSLSLSSSKPKVKKQTCLRYKLNTRKCQKTRNYTK